MRRLATLGLLAALALAPMSARAQPNRLWVSSSELAGPLRERVEALRGEADDAALDSIEALLAFEGDRRVRRRREALPWVQRAQRYLEELEAGRDPYVGSARGEITLRAYRSPISESPPTYAVYVPPDYDPARRYPMLVALHGGSSNGNLFAGLMLGARVPWESYRDNWDRPHTPGITPQWIVVAPDGFGNSMWRFLGERDVLDVIADAQRHYAIDPDRVVLAGLSNGGLGSYTIGTRHAWRFAAVAPMAGAPSWTMYLGAHPNAEERRMLDPMSGWRLFENARNTAFHAHHGRRDPGRMRPRYVEALAAHASALEVPFTLDWYPTGHDLVGPVRRRSAIFEGLAERRRAQSPEAVTLITGDYRAARQHWVEVTRIDRYPSVARIDARVERGSVVVRTLGARAITLHLGGAPARRGAEVWVDGQRVGPSAGEAMTLARENGRWRVSAPPTTGKRPGLSGPLPDASYERLIHVYGTARESDTALLRESAEAGARGWIGNLRGVRQRVVADTDVTPEMMREAHVVLYGTPGANTVLERLWDRLPIQVERGAVVVGSERHTGRRVGTRFLVPNPLAPERYVVVQAASTAQAVRAGSRLAAFLPDWVVYDGAQLPEQRPNLPTAGYRARGFFDDEWRLVQ